MASISELTSSSGLIFSGTVMKIGESSVPELPARRNLLVVRVDRGLRVDPALGDLRGSMVTVETPSPEAFHLQQEAVFFTKSWIHGREIAVREVGHLEKNTEDPVAAEVQALPDMHLKARLASARLVVAAEVVEVRTIPGQVPERRAPLWAVAVLRVEAALKGYAEFADVYFPTSDSHRWIKSPRFHLHQRGVFVLTEHEPRAEKWLAAIGQPDGLTALEPADFQPESKAGDIRSFLPAR